MTRTKLLSILQEETDGFNEQSRLRDDVLDAMEEAYLKGKREQLIIADVSVPKGTVCPLCGSKDDKHGWVSGGYRCPNGWSKHT